MPLTRPELDSSPRAQTTLARPLFKRCWWGITLFAVLMLAATLRVWNFRFDRLTDQMPLTYDAYSKYLMAEQVVRGHTRPLSYNQPYFLIYTTAGLFRLSRFFGAADNLWLWDLTVLYMIACSVTTVALTAAMARVLFNDRRVALMAALFFAVAPVSVIGSRYFKEDIPLMLLANAALFFLLRMIREPRGLNYAAAGLCIGLAASAKYAGFGLIPFYLLAHVLAALSAPAPGRLRLAFNPWFLVGLLLIPAGFLLFNPFVVTNWRAFCAALHAQAEYVKRGHHDGTAIRGGDYWWLFYLRYALLPGLTFPLMAAALAGWLMALWRRRPLEWFAAVFVLVNYLAAEKGLAKPFPFFARYLHQVVPMLCVFAAWALLALYDARQARPWRGVAWAVMALCAFVPLLHSALVTAELPRDTRLTATDWINAHLEPGARVFLDDAYYSPRPSTEKFHVRYARRMYRESPESLRRWGADYLVLNSFRLGRYDYSAPFNPTAAAIRERYRDLLRDAVQVREFRPRFSLQTYGFHNPIIWVYRLPQASSSATVGGDRP